MGPPRQPERAEAYLRTTIVNLVRGDHRRRMVAQRHDHGGDITVGSAEDAAMGRVGREVTADVEGHWSARIEFPEAPVGGMFVVRLTNSASATVYELPFTRTA